MIFFRPRALLGVSPFRAAIISSSLTTSFAIYSSGYIKPNISLRSASIGSRKNYSVRIVAFSSLLWYRVSSPSLLIGGNYSRAFGFLSAIRAYFTILYTPLGSFVSSLTVYLYSLFTSRRITLFFLLYATL